MSSKKLLKGAQTGGIRLISRNLFLLASLIVLISCFAFISCDVPEENDVTDIILSSDKLNIPAGDRDYLSFTVVPAGATYEKVEWKSSETSIVTVNNGIISTQGAQSLNTAVVSVTIGAITAKCNITVTSAPTGKAVTGVTFSKSEITLTVGGTGNLAPNISPSDAARKDVFWISGNTGVATVDSTGKVTAVSTGSAKITVYTKNGGKDASYTVTVQGSGSDDDVKSVSLNKTNLTLDVGGSETLTATVQPSSAKVTWDSGDESKVTVDNNGKVTAVAAGQTTITASAGAYEATCFVTVNAVPVTGVSISPASLTLLKGETANLTALVLPTNASNKEIKSWASSNAAVASVSVLSGQVLAVAQGTATITVTTTDGSKTGTCMVTVINALTLGNYTGTYKGTDNKDYTETVELTSKSFKIYDNYKSGADLEFIDFSITKWENASAPSSYDTTYIYGYKLTGKITGANPKYTNNLYGTFGAPNFSEDDINTTECWIYIYITSDGKFIRSVFSKAGGTDNKAPVSSTSTAVRVYTKAS